MAPGGLVFSEKQTNNVHIIIIIGRSDFDLSYILKCVPFDLDSGMRLL